MRSAITLCVVLSCVSSLTRVDLGPARMFIIKWVFRSLTPSPLRLPYDSIAVSLPMVQAKSYDYPKFGCVRSVTVTPLL